MTRWRGVQRFYLGVESKAAVVASLGVYLGTWLSKAA